jgi:fatty-acyl-CoA synthase
MMGYLAPANADESLRKRRRNPFQGPEDPSEWAVFTGDLGYADEDGFLFLKGRRDGMIKVMGNRVYPQEVTHQVLAVSGIRDAVVAVVDDPPGSAALIAFVVTEPSSRLSAASIRQALKSRLPAYMVPRRICLVGEIPRTTSGKPDSRQLLAEIDGCLCPSARGEEPT